jgi:hypothetical protein
MLRKRTILFTALILFALIVTPTGNAWAHTNLEKRMLETGIGGNDAYNIQANTNNYEPDNSAGLAKLITSGIPQTRSIVPKTDVDWVKFQLTATSAVLLETSGPLHSDTRISLFNANLTPIELNDDAGPPPFYSYIDRICDIDPLPAGTYYVRVEEYLRDAEILSYNLMVDASPCPAELVGIYTGGTKQGSSLLTLHRSTRRSLVGVNSGPVKIVNTGPTSLVASERVIYKVNGVNTSFTEIMALPDSQLDTIYWLPWYNNKDLDTQLRFANVSDVTANVQITIGGQLMGSFDVLAGASVRKSYAGVNNGPVQIASSQKIVVAERVFYRVNGVNTSFSEIMGLPAAQLDNTYWLPWYNNVDLDTQLRIANVSDQQATITITIGGVPKGSFPLAEGASTRLSYAGVNAGPVKIEGTQNIVAAERVIYKVDEMPTSFSELMALPNNQLSTTYWMPWYLHSKDLDTQLRIANVTTSPATVRIYIGGVEMAGSPFSLPAGISVRKSFPGINAGPVRIESDQDIVAAERLIYKVNTVPTSFSEMMGLPNDQLDLIHWLPWYNNVDLDSQLRFGLP